MHHLPLLLFTMTTFANQAEYSTSLMKFAASSFSTSSFNTFFLLSLNFLLYWVTFAFRFRKSLCAIKLGSIPSILVPSKRKKSLLSLRHLINSSSMFGGNDNLILLFCSRLPIRISFKSSAGWRSHSTCSH